MVANLNLTGEESHGDRYRRVLVGHNCSLDVFERQVAECQSMYVDGRSDWDFGSFDFLTLVFYVIGTDTVGAYELFRFECRNLESCRRIAAKNHVDTDIVDSSRHFDNSVFVSAGDSINDLRCPHGGVRCGSLSFGFCFGFGHGLRFGHGLWLSPGSFPGIAYLEQVQRLLVLAVQFQSSVDIFKGLVYLIYIKVSLRSVRIGGSQFRIFGNQ